MAITLSKRMAQKIVDTVKDVCEYDINFINTDGIIFASTNDNRIGEFHEIGKKVTETKEIIEVETDNSFYGTQKGVNIPFFYKHEIIAAIGISGVPDEVRQFALLAQKITSLLLREQEIDTLNYGYKNQENAIVRCLIENKAVNQDFLKEFLATKNLSVNEKYRTIIIKPDIRYNHSNMAMLEAEIHKIFGNINSAMCSISYPCDYWIIINEKDYTNWKVRLNKWAASYSKILTIGIGCSESINRQHISYEKADIAINSLTGTKNIACYDELVLEIITGSIPESIAVMYKEKVLHGLKPEDIDMLKIYFENNMSLKKTSEAMYIHKNTVQYRLNTIEELTGYNPRVFTDAVILYLAIVIH